MQTLLDAAFRLRNIHCLVSQFAMQSLPCVTSAGHTLDDFSSDFEPSSYSCNSFFESGRISALSCIVCHAEFVQCTGKTRSD